jgi:hypothetical protein
LANSCDNYHVDKESVTLPRVDDKMAGKKVPPPAPVEPNYSINIDIKMKVHQPAAPPLLHYNRQKSLYPHWCQEAEWSHMTWTQVVIQWVGRIVQ